MPTYIASKVTPIRAGLQGYFKNSLAWGPILRTQNSSLTVFLAPERRLGTQEDFARSPSLQDRKLPKLEFGAERSSQEPGFFSGLFANTGDFYTKGKFHFPSCGLQI